MSKEIEANEPGKCPFCGSFNVMHDDHEFDGQCLIYDIICNDCGKTSEEIYNVEFVKTTPKEE